MSKHFLSAGILIPIALFVLMNPGCKKETEIIPPTVVTVAVSNIRTDSAECGGNITEDGHGEVTARGIVWGKTSLPTLESNLGFTADGAGLGVYKSILYALDEGTLYYVRAFATNKAGTAYGNEQQFTTALVNLPIVSTSLATEIEVASARVGGEVTGNGGSAVTERGIYWSTEQNPELTGTKMQIETGMGLFSATLGYLTPYTDYYIKAYAKNSKGEALGSQVSFKTLSNYTQVTTNAVTDITDTSARLGGIVTNDGGSTVTEQGVYLGTSEDVETSGTQLPVQDEYPGFDTVYTMLTPFTHYYVKAYAKNDAGETLGALIEFTTNCLACETGSVQDYDNNSYPTVQIGSQWWMAENLKTTHYNNGSAIPRLYDSVEWSQNTSGAYCYLDNDTTFADTYGALYNFYAIVNPAQLCPTGWHAPSNADWSALESNLGGFLVAGGKLKETGTTHWLPPNTGASNLSGFTALPGGTYSGSVYESYYSQTAGYWWSSTDDGIYRAFIRVLTKDSESFSNYTEGKNAGASVRCIKN